MSKENVTSACTGNKLLQDTGEQGVSDSARCEMPTIVLKARLESGKMELSKNKNKIVAYYWAVDRSAQPAKTEDGRTRHSNSSQQQQEVSRQIYVTDTVCRYRRTLTMRHKLQALSGVNFINPLSMKYRLNLGLSTATLVILLF